MSMTTSRVTSIAQAPSRLSAGIASIRQKAALASAKTTQPEYCQSFGNRLSEIGGQCRWEIIGHALDLWLQDLSPRIDELLHENEGVIFRRVSIRSVPISRHCWMLGPSFEYAHPTAVICCSESLLLKRIMRVILQHTFLGEKGFELKGIPACDIRLLMDSMAPLQSPRIPYISRSPQEIGYDYNENPWLVCGAGLVIHDSGRSTTLGGVVEVDGVTFGLTAGHALNDALAPQVNTTNKEDVVLFDSDWALESPNESEEEFYFGQDLEDNELIDSEGQSVQYIHRTVSADIPGLKPRVQSLGIVAASVQGSSRDQQTCDWILIELPDVLQNKANAIDVYGQIVHDIEVDPTQRLVKLLTRRGQIHCFGVGSASSIKLLGSEVFIDVWSLYSNDILGNIFLVTIAVYKDANDVQEPGDSGSWAIDLVSNKLLGVVVADCNTTGEIFIMPARAIFADIKLRLQATELRLPRYRPGHPPIPTKIPTPTTDRSATIEQVKSQLAQQPTPLASPANDKDYYEQLASTTDDDLMKGISKASKSPWNSYKAGGSSLKTGSSSHEVRI